MLYTDTSEFKLLFLKKFRLPFNGQPKFFAISPFYLVVAGAAFLVFVPFVAGFVSGGLMVSIND